MADDLLKIKVCAANPKWERIMLSVLKQNRIKSKERTVTNKSIAHTIHVTEKQWKKLDASIWMEQVLQNAKNYARKRDRKTTR